MTRGCASTSKKGPERVRCGQLARALALWAGLAAVAAAEPRLSSLTEARYGEVPGDERRGEAGRGQFEERRAIPHPGRLQLPADELE